MKKALIILGPTSTGKTDLGIFLAKKFNGEVISCDSRQVYKRLDIGSGKLPSINSDTDFKKNKNYWIIGGIKVYCLDIASPKKQYSVWNFYKDAKKALNDIEIAKKLPIFVGGSGFYIKALTEGIENLNLPINEKLRKDLESLELEKLQEKIRKISQEKWHLMNNSDKKNKRRLIRTIEIQVSGKNKKLEKIDGLLKNYDVLKIGLTASIDILRDKIKLRVQKRIDQGLIEEGEALKKNGLTLKRFKELGLDYAILADYLTGKISKDILIEQISLKNGQYAKRQITWFKKEKNVNWFDITNQTNTQKVERSVSFWYDEP